MNEGTKQERILIVDDDERIVRFVALKLKVEGYQVLSAVNGYEGLKMAESGDPDIILLDLAMPVLDGFEVLRRLGKSSDLPVIVMTARTDAAHEALNLGACDFIAKPFLPDELARRVRTILDRKR